jgi:LmbE family N-acetylglucosaminyl deacetylase
VNYDPDTCVLSPHLDDAVLSCFAELDAGAGVITVFAGLPPSDAEPSNWDRCCGFDDAVEHMLARRAENDTVLDGLDVAHDELGFPEAPHADAGHPPRPTPVELAALITLRVPVGRRLLAPVALSPTPNPDHVLLRDAALLLAAGGWRVELYGDLPHLLKQVGRWPVPIDPAGPIAPVQWLGLRELPLSPPVIRRLPPPVAEEKATAMRGYRTQFRPLTTMLRAPGRDVLKRPEVYSVEVTWRVVP